jgi:hypothetical protein
MEDRRFWAKWQLALLLNLFMNVIDLLVLFQIFELSHSYIGIITFLLCCNFILRSVDKAWMSICFSLHQPPYYCPVIITGVRFEVWHWCCWRHWFCQMWRYITGRVVFYVLKDWSAFTFRFKQDCLGPKMKALALLAQQHSITLQKSISCVVGMFMFTVIKLKKLEWPLIGWRHATHSHQMRNPPSLLGL